MWNETPFYVKATIKLLLAIMVVFVLIMGREFLVPFTIAVFFTFLLLPISRKLVQWRIPKIPSILISILIAFIFFGGIIYFFVSQIESFSDDLPQLKMQFHKKWESLQQFIFTNFRISKYEQSKWINLKVNETLQSADGYALDIFSATGTFIANLALIPIYIFFLTYYKDRIRNFIIQLNKKTNPSEVISLLSRISEVSQKYLKGILLDVLILSVLNSTGFLLLGLDHAILFGILASILNIIPYIGVLIGSLLPIAMALLTKDEIGNAIGVAAVTQFVQLLDNNFITPLVVGSSVSINPFAAVVALIISALIWGLPGMVLCMPVAGMIKVLCDHTDALKPYGYLIGEDDEKKVKRKFSYNPIKFLKKNR